ncbi:hypothetical protein DRQ53_14755 [bacterium]|nr:MAG: hypothetical protein DRQ53_14755 [bacterium]
MASRQSPASPGVVTKLGTETKVLQHTGQQSGEPVSQQSSSVAFSVNGVIEVENGDSASQHESPSAVVAMDSGATARPTRKVAKVSRIQMVLRLVLMALDTAAPTREQSADDSNRSGNRTGSPRCGVYACR